MRWWWWEVIKDIQNLKAAICEEYEGRNCLTEICTREILLSTVHYRKNKIGASENGDDYLGTVYGIIYAEESVLVVEN